MENLKTYTSYDKIIVDNGSFLSILYHDYSNLNVHYHTLHLSNVLYTPHVSSNLLSIHRLCSSKDVSMEFNA